MVFKKFWAFKEIFLFKSDSSSSFFFTGVASSATSAIRREFSVWEKTKDCSFCSRSGVFWADRLVNWSISIKLDTSTLWRFARILSWRVLRSWVFKRLASWRRKLCLRPCWEWWNCGCQKLISVSSTVCWGASWTWEVECYEVASIIFLPRGLNFLVRGSGLGSDIFSWRSARGGGAEGLAPTIVVFCFISCRARFSISFWDIAIRLSAKDDNLDK